MKGLHGVLKINCNPILALGMMTVFIPLVSVGQSIIVSESFTEEVEEKFGKNDLIKQVLMQSGLMTALEAVALIRDEEMTKLAATHGRITEQELAAVKARLMGSVIESIILDQVERHLGKEFSIAELQMVLRNLESPSIGKAKQIQRRVDGLRFQEEIRDYRLRLKESPPRESRVQLMKQLAVVEHHNALNTMIKVEVRKSLLTSITYVKDNMIPSEKELNRQMTSFRKRVASESHNQRLEQYLYLFRATPSSEIQNVIREYEQSGLQRIVDSCEKRITKEFSIGRQRRD